MSSKDDIYTKESLKEIQILCMESLRLTISQNWQTDYLTLMSLEDKYKTLTCLLYEDTKESQAWNKNKKT